MPILLEELAGSPNVNLTRGSVTGERLFKVPWADRLTAAYEVLGYVGGVVVAPVPLPEFPDTRPRSVAISPFVDSATNDGGNATYDHAVLRVQYDTGTSSGGGGGGGGELPTVFEEEFQGESSTITLPTRRLYWNDLGASGLYEPIADVDAPQKLIPRVRWSITVFGMNAVPAGIFSEMGKCNQNLINSPAHGLDFPAETLLYLSGSVRREFNPDGPSGFTVTLQFMAQAYSWNKFHKPGVAEPQPIYTEDGIEFKPVETSPFESTLAIPLPTV